MFKVTKVTSQIRGSGSLFWYKDKYSDYFCNGYWAIKTNLEKEEYRKILAILVEKFGTFPKIGEELTRSINYKSKGILKSETIPNWVELLENQDLEKLEDTKLIYKLYGTDYRILKGKDYVYINTKFIEMIDENLISANFEGNGRLQPIYARNEDDSIIILPMRMAEENEYLKKLDIDLGGGKCL